MRKASRQHQKQERVGMITGLTLLGILVILFFVNLAAGEDLVRVSDSVTGSLNVAFGQRESEGIYLGEDHQLLADIAPMDEKQVSMTMSAINQFAYSRSDLSFYLMLVPEPAAILADRLPANVQLEDEQAQFAEVQAQVGRRLTWVDPWEILSKYKDEDVYYKTEKVWTTKGAYYGFQALAETMGLDLDKLPELEAYAVSADFNGSLSKESGFEKSYVEPIYFYAAKDSADEATVLVEAGSTKMATLYNAEALDTEEQLNLFLGGDRDYLDIHTLAGGNRKLLLVKDTYANSLVSFLTYYFQEIVVVDSASYEGNVKEILREKDITDVLFLYGGDDFVTTDSICRVLDYEASE